MNPTRLLSILLVLSLATAGCGGGGGGGGNGVGVSAASGDTGSNPPPVNSAPTLSGVPQSATQTGVDWVFVPQVSDPDGDALSFRVENAPDWLTLNLETGELRGTPPPGTVGTYDNILLFVSDGETETQLDAFSIAVMPEQISRAAFEPQGEVYPTENGYRSVGTLKVTTNNGLTLLLEESDLDAEFDEDGLLVSLNGETLLPEDPTGTLKLRAPVRAIVGTRWGWEINEDDRIDLDVHDDTQYIVYLLDGTVEFDVTDPGTGVIDTLTLTTPLDGQLLLIMDITDPMYYYYGRVPLVGARGEGRSLHGLLPFVPKIEWEELDGFGAKFIEKGSFSIGKGGVDFMDIHGTRAASVPMTTDIDWSDPLDTSILQFRAGFNGEAVVKIPTTLGYLDLDYSKVSGTLDVGVERQHMAARYQIQPENFLAPDFPLRATAEMRADLRLNTTDGLLMEIFGSYGITNPDANIAGSLRIENEDVTLTGTVGAGDLQLTMTAGLVLGGMEATVHIPPELTNGLAPKILDDLDEQLVEVEQAVTELTDAIGDYEHELSLRGLRDQLPAIADRAIKIISPYPARVKDAAYDQALDAMYTNCALRVCAYQLPGVDELQIAAGVSVLARNQAQEYVDHFVGVMKELKHQAQAADAEELRAALKRALFDAHYYRNFNRRFSYSRDFGYPIGDVELYYFSESIELIPAGQADQIKFAHDNIHRISETDSIRLSAQEIVDQLPTEEVLNRVRQEVADGTAQIPTIDSGGFLSQGSLYEPYVVVDGIQRSVDFNILNPAEAQDGIADLIRNDLVN